MTKGKKWTLRLLGVAALALLICLCLMGSTMARYTSQGDGSGSLTVALWDLETTEVTLPDNESISPATEDLATYKEEHSGEEARSNPSNWMISFGLYNNSDVAAKVKVEQDDSGVTMLWPDDDTSSNYCSTWAWGYGWQETGVGHTQTDSYGGPLMAKFSDKTTFTSLVNSEKIFKIELGYSESNNDDGSGITKLSEIDWDNEEEWIPVANDTTVYFYAEVVWTSADASENYESYSFETAEEYADAIDSILGMYVSTLSFGVTWTAVQAGVQPDPNAGGNAP